MCKISSEYRNRIRVSERTFILRLQNFLDLYCIIDKMHFHYNFNASYLSTRNVIIITFLVDRSDS